MSTISAAFLAFLGVSALTDLGGWGHQWAPLAWCAIWFAFCRSLTPAGWRRLVAAALALSVLIACLAVAQAFIMPRSRGPFASPNFLGGFGAMMFFVALRARRASEPSPAGGSWLPAWLWVTPWIAALANLLSVALSQSRGALVALAAGGAVLLWRRSRLAAIATPLIAAAAVLLIAHPGSRRIDIWTLGWQAALQRPLTGWGQGGLVVAGADHFYSIPLDIFAASGVLGLAAGAWLFIAAWNAGPRPHRAILAAWLVQGLFLSAIPATTMLFLAVLARLDRPEAEEAEPPMAEPARVLLTLRTQGRSPAPLRGSSRPSTAERWCGR